MAILARRVPTCRNCDPNDFSDPLCKSDMESCGFKTIGQKTLAIAANVICAPVAGAGCPSLGTATYQGEGFLDVAWNAAKNSYEYVKIKTG